MSGEGLSITHEQGGAPCDGEGEGLRVTHEGGEGLSVTGEEELTQCDT